jgi:hypothetical protein
VKDLRVSLTAETSRKNTFKNAGILNFAFSGSNEASATGKYQQLLLYWIDLTRIKY